MVGWWNKRQGKLKTRTEPYPLQPCTEVLIWIHLAQNRNLWWSLVNTVMNGDGCLLGCCAM
jgi:hypothetical protein